MAEFYSWFVLLAVEKNEPFGLPFFINPSVTSCHLPYILRCKTQGRRVILTLRSLQCDTPAYGARQGRSLEVALYSFAMNKRSGLYFSNSTPSPCGHSPYIPCRNTPQCCGTRQGERRGNSITSIVGIFNPSPRRYTPQLSLIFSCATHRNASGHGRGGG